MPPLPTSLAPWEPRSLPWPRSLELEPVVHCVIGFSCFFLFSQTECLRRPLQLGLHAETKAIFPPAVPVPCPSLFKGLRSPRGWGMGRTGQSRLVNHPRPLCAWLLVLCLQALLVLSVHSLCLPPACAALLSRGHSSAGGRRWFISTSLGFGLNFIRTFSVITVVTFACSPSLWLGLSFPVCADHRPVTWLVSGLQVTPVAHTGLSYILSFE